jgi:hypothetical protein
LRQDWIGSGWRRKVEFARQEQERLEFGEGALGDADEVAVVLARSTAMSLGDVRRDDVAARIIWPEIRYSSCLGI